MKNLTIYLTLFVTLSLPFVFDLNFEIPRNFEAEKFFESTAKIVKENRVVFVSLDFGPGTSAENYPQAAVVTEHLFRLGAKIVFLSLSPQAQPFLESIPSEVLQNLDKEGFSKEYGSDYVVLGFRPAPAVFLQGLLRSDNLAKYLGKDIHGRVIEDYPIAQKLTTAENITAWYQFTGLAGMVQNYIQFLETGKKIKLYHGCTSVIVPEAYIYLDSNQISGLLEG
ncbi:MAG: hypothetical protein NZO16_05720, partial [Deltaproteobacteria bacterium]|nr:hypothetical protein [Deltaproteobacteria bacterium]